MNSKNSGVAVAWMVLLYRDHPSAAYQNTSVAQLANMPLVLPVKGYSIRAFLDKVFQEANLIPDIAMEINVTDMLLKLVDTGKWCTVLMKTFCLITLPL